MSKKVFGYELKALPEKPIGEPFNACCRKSAGEGVVLLKNSNNVLPLAKGSNVSVFGRIQINYLKSGTGSGGGVNAPYVADVINGLENSGININRKLLNIYKKWVEENPFDNGNGWATEPPCQVEMKLDDKTVNDAADESDAAIVIIGRLSGEDKDNNDDEGCYLLTETERDMLLKVRNSFSKVIVLLNVSNIIDMKWVEEYNPDAVLYIWHGGQEGGNAVGDLLSGDVTPSGKLTDTIAYNLKDYSSSENFGGDQDNIYSEDIYVGYRYFNTFAKQKVMYPFGFGLSYTTFSYSDFDFKVDNLNATISLKVKNTGNYSGKEVVQIYCSAPQGKLGKPERVLVGYKKTDTLLKGEEETVKIDFPFKNASSFDDTGVTGFESSFVLEKGTYKFFVSSNAVTDYKCFEYVIEQDTVIEKCSKAMAPQKTFERIKPILNGESFELSKEKVTGTIEKTERRANINEIPFTGDRGIKLCDVKNGKNSMEEFIAQLTDYDLACISMGEGMNSPKVTAGTGCAFGGLTESLKNLGIPIACGSDGPSGIHVASCWQATSIPSGTMLACTWNDELVEELHTYMGMELYAYKIDTLLGPGMNIHRHPLNGRNFEYFAEDPLISGNIALAICKGIAKSGNTCVIKHFCCNNQEKNRHNVNSVVSERALREIYLKPFEIVVKQNVCKAIMTSYNPVNGYWGSGNYDLTTTVLREDWGYDGFVMSDWWAKTEKEFSVWGRTSESTALNFEPMVTAQNDIYMVHPETDDFSFNSILADLKSGKIKRADAQRNAMNICRYLMNSNAFERFSDISADDTKTNICDKEIISTTDFDLHSALEFEVAENADYDVVVDIVSNASELSQNTLTLYANGEFLVSLTVNGTSGETVSFKRQVKIGKGNVKITASYPEGKIEVKSLKVFGC